MEMEKHADTLLTFWRRLENTIESDIKTCKEGVFIGVKEMREISEILSKNRADAFNQGGVEVARYFEGMTDLMTLIANVNWRGWGKNDIEVKFIK